MSVLTDDGYRQLMKHAQRLAQSGHDELAQHLRDMIGMRADADRFRWLARADGCPFAETDDVWFVWNELAKQIDAAMAQGKV